MRMRTSDKFDQTPQTEDDKEGSKFPFFSAEDNFKNKGGHYNECIEEMQTTMGSVTEGTVMSPSDGP